MNIIVGLLIVLACVALIFVVIIQKSKGGGLATNLTGGAAIAQQMGMRRGTDFIERATWYLMGFIAILTFVGTLSISDGATKPAAGAGNTVQEIQNARPTQAPTSAPNIQQIQGQQGQQQTPGAAQQQEQQEEQQNPGGEPKP